MANHGANTGDIADSETGAEHEDPAYRHIPLSGTVLTKGDDLPASAWMLAWLFFDGLIIANLSNYAFRHHINTAEALHL